jgi:Icc protein
MGLAMLLVGCVKYSPYEVTVSDDEANQTAKNLVKLQQLDQRSDTITFAFIGDTQRFYDESYDFVRAVNQKTEVEFVVISGDLTDFGLDDEFTGMLKIFKRLAVPFLTVIGNHDLIYNGEEVYEEMFGELDYSFLYKQIKFIHLNTNSREFAFNGKVPNINWLNNQLSDTANYTNAVVIGHVPPGHDDFDARLELPYANTLAKWGKTTLSMNGHNHNFNIGTPYNDGIIYLNSFSVSKGYYVVVKLWPNGFDYEIVPL